MKNKILHIILIFCVILIKYVPAYANEEKIVKIGAGHLLDGYYHIGIKLCRYISQSNKGIKCEVVPTSGSLENLRLLQEGKIDFAFALSNLALQAYEATGYFAENEPFKDLTQLLNLHDSYFTVITKDKDHILTFADLNGRNISNGPANSDSSTAYFELEKYYHFDEKPKDIEIAYEDYARDFCNGKVDAIMLMSGHPNMLVNMITHSCESDFLTIDPEKIDMLIKDDKGFYKAILHKNSYPGITRDEATLAISSIFVTGKTVDKHIIHNFLLHLKHKISALKTADPVLYDLSNEHFTTGFVLPSFKN